MTSLPTAAGVFLPDVGLDLDVPAAYAYCDRIARGHYENFTVGSWFLPRAARPHVTAVYAFCRGVDDLGDEAPPDQRLPLLDLWQAELEACWGGAPRHPVFRALQATIRDRGLPQEPFLRLIEANRMDQRIVRWPTWADLRRYCVHSADPVGRLFLNLFGYRDESLYLPSDATCTALQLANFWQDVATDWGKGRVYLPQEDLARFGAAEADIAAGRATPAFRELMRFEVDRARALFREGLPLVDRLDGVVRLDVRLFSEGGMAILDAIEAQKFDVLRRRPTLSRTRKTWMMLRYALPLFWHGRFGRVPPPTKEAA